MPGYEAAASRTSILSRLLQRCWENDIITVVAAGNAGEVGYTLDQGTPQNLGKRQNPLITVGGVYVDGRLWPGTNLLPPGDAAASEAVENNNQGQPRRGVGSISVYAVSHDVLAADAGGNEAIGRRSGTSAAAAAVSGLAAYFASLDSQAQYFPPGEVAMRMKDYVAKFAYTRRDDPVPPEERARRADDGTKVAYNRDPEDLCSRDSPVKRIVSNGQGRGSISRRQNEGDEDVKVDGTIVASNWVQSVCSPTASSSIGSTQTSSTGTATTSLEKSSTTSPTTTTSSSEAPAPTVHISQGILTCGTETHADDDALFFGLDEMASARDTFCGNMTTHDPPIVFEPGKPDYRQHVYVPPKNIYHKIRVSANWTAGADSDCETFDFSKIDGFIDDNHYPAYEICQRRVDVPI